MYNNYYNYIYFIYVQTLTIIEQRFAVPNIASQLSDSPPHPPASTPVRV